DRLDVDERSGQRDDVGVQVDRSHGSFHHPRLLRTAYARLRRRTDERPARFEYGDIEPCRHGVAAGTNARACTARRQHVSQSVSERPGRRRYWPYVAVAVLTLLTLMGT